MSRVGQFGQISEINDHLYLSGAGVIKPESLRQKGITCIINATVEEPNVYLNGIDYLKIRVEDTPTANLDTYFDLAADKIKAVKERGGKTLVHCVAGVSRSASLCIVYLVKHHRLTLRQAYFKVKSSRPIIHPNPGFWKQMIEYELKLSGKNTVHLVPSRHEGKPVPDLYAEGRKSIASLQQQTSNAVGGRRSSSGGEFAKYSPPGSSYSGLLARHGASSYSSGSTAGVRSNGGGYTASAYRRSPSPFSTWSPNRYNRRTTTAPLPSKTKGNIFSSLYQTHQDILFPSF